MFTWMWIVGIARLGPVAVGAGAATGFTDLTCEEFEQGAHFDPYEILDSMWKIFYFWANNTEAYPIVFSIPVKQRIDKIRSIVDVTHPDMGVEWHKATLLMEPRPGTLVVFLYGGTPGAFRALVQKEQRHTVRPYPPPLIRFADVRMKVVGRFLGMMCCEDLSAYALARMDEMPETEDQCARGAALFGFRGPGGRSYLHVDDLRKRHSVRPYPPPLIRFADVRMKVVGRFLGMMCCEDLSAYALARMDEMPETEDQCARGAALFGFRGPGGRSYLHVDDLRKRHSVRPYPPPLIRFADVRMKVVGRFLGMMCCEDLSAYALARMDEMPETEDQCARGAALFGFRGPGGRSYLHVDDLRKRHSGDEL